MPINLLPEHMRLLLELLNKEMPEAEVWAYGSRVNGTHHEGSDLDLVLRNPVQLEEPVKGIHQLRSALSGSNLPILVEVLDWARLPKSFRHEIEREHAVLRPPLRTAESDAP